MVRVTATDFQKEAGRFQDVALVETVVVTRNGRDLAVMISAAEYQRLKRRDREVLSLDDFTQADLDEIRLAEPSAEAAEFDHEFK